MNRGVAVELDSLRLAHYGNQVPCLICDEGNTLDAENVPQLLSRRWSWRTRPSRKTPAR